MFPSHLTPIEHQNVAKLIGEKCEINCVLGDKQTTALLDTGTQVSIVSKAFLTKHFPELEIKNVTELLGGQALELAAINKENF